MKFEVPKLVSLSESAKVYGYCTTGEEAAGSCGGGGTPFPPIGCAGGSSFSAVCGTGSLVTPECMAGGVPSAACSGGGNL